MQIFVSKKIVYAAVAVFILATGIGIGIFFSNIGERELSTGKEVSAEADAVAEVSEALFQENSTFSELVRVARVIDGDTIEIEGGETVRLVGIDTAETVDPRKPVQCFGVESAKKTAELLEGELVRLEKDITDRDRYSRLLRYVWLGNTLINRELVVQGFALSYSYPPDIKYQDQFVSAEQEAREAKRGLWSACISETTGESISVPVPQVTSAPSSPTCTIKGNISASGEKIYHLSACGSYSKTTIDENRGEQWFCSESDAQSAGWRRALNCP